MDWPICIIDDKAEAELYKSLNYADPSTRAIFIERGWIDPTGKAYPFGERVLWRWANIPAIHNIYYNRYKKSE